MTVTGEQADGAEVAGGPEGIQRTSIQKGSLVPELRRHFIEISLRSEVNASVAHISNLQRRIGSQFLLNSDVPLPTVGRYATRILCSVRRHSRTRQRCWRSQGSNVGS